MNNQTNTWKIIKPMENKVIKITSKELDKLIKEEYNLILKENSFKQGFSGIQNKIFDWIFTNIVKLLPRDQILKAGQNIESQFGPNPNFQSVSSKLGCVNESLIKEQTIQLDPDGIAEAFVNTVSKVAGINLKALGGLILPFIVKLLTKTGTGSMKNDLSLWLVTAISSIAIVALGKVYTQIKDKTI
jgi:hypothetical protein